MNRPVDVPGSSPIDDHDHQLDEPEDADAEHLPDEQVARLDGRQHDLDDAALLLLDDAGQDPRPEREDRDEQEDHADVREQERRVPVRVGRLELRTAGGC